MTQTVTSIKTPSPRDERVAKQRAVDVRVKRLGKIVILAEALKEPKNEAFVSFGIMGSSFILGYEESKTLAGSMLSQTLAEHRADPDADPLPRELQLVLEIVDAGKTKSPSMVPDDQKEAPSVGSADTSPTSVGRGGKTKAKTTNK